MPIEFHDLPSTLPRIEHIWAFLAVDAEGSEGVCATQIGNFLAPLIAADPARLASLHEIAKDLAGLTKKRIVLARFTARVDEGEIEP